MASKARENIEIVVKPVSAISLDVLRAEETMDILSLSTDIAC